MILIVNLFLDIELMDMKLYLIHKNLNLQVMLNIQNYCLRVLIELKKRQNIQYKIEEFYVTAVLRNNSDGDGFGSSRCYIVKKLFSVAS